MDAAAGHVSGEAGEADADAPPSEGMPESVARRAVMLGRSGVFEAEVNEFRAAMDAHVREGRHALSEGTLRILESKARKEAREEARGGAVAFQRLLRGKKMADVVGAAMAEEEARIRARRRAAENKEREARSIAVPVPDLLLSAAGVRAEVGPFVGEERPEDPKTEAGPKRQPAPEPEQPEQEPAQEAEPATAVSPAVAPPRAAPRHPVRSRTVIVADASEPRRRAVVAALRRAGAVLARGCGLDEAEDELRRFRARPLLLVLRPRAEHEMSRAPPGARRRAPGGLRPPRDACDVLFHMRHAADLARVPVLVLTPISVAVTSAAVAGGPLPPGSRHLLEAMRRWVWTGADAVLQEQLLLGGAHDAHVLDTLEAAVSARSFSASGAHDGAAGGHELAAALVRAWDALRVESGARLAMLTRWSQPQHAPHFPRLVSGLTRLVEAARRHGPTSAAATAEAGHLRNELGERVRVPLVLGRFE